MPFWPGIPGEFIGMLPVRLIFALSASLVAALIYLPVMGGVTGRMGHILGGASDFLIRLLPRIVRALLDLPAMMIVFTGAMLTLNP